MSTITAPAKRTLTIPPTMNLARFSTAAESVSDISGISFGDRRCRRRTALFALFEASMGAGKYHRHEEQCGNRGKQEAADHRAAERRVLFGPFAQAERHGDHADDHRQCRHQYRAYAGRPGVESRPDRSLPLAHALPRKRNDQDA